MVTFLISPPQEAERGNKEMQSFTGMRRNVALGMGRVKGSFRVIVDSIVILLCVSILCTVCFHYLCVSRYVYVYVMCVCYIYLLQGNYLIAMFSHTSLGVETNGVFCVHGT